MVVVPSIPYMCSSSYSQAKMPPRSTKIFKHELHMCIAKRERFPEMNDTISFRKTLIRISARENTAYIVWFSENSGLNFPYNQLISPDLSEISRLKNNSTD